MLVLLFIGSTALAEGDGGGYGIHSEMFTTGLMKLHEAGKVTVEFDPAVIQRAGIEQAIDQSLLTLERARLAEQIEYTRARLAEAEAVHDQDELERLQR